MELDKIIFRGFQKSWEYGGFHMVDGLAYIVNENGTFEVNPKSVGQFICKHDSNGVAIYTGDILEGPFTLNGFSNNPKAKICRMTVEWIDAEFHINKITTNSNSRYRFYPDEEDCVIIENLYENSLL